MSGETTHPIYVPSKGRWQKDRRLTVKALQRDRVPFRLVVQPAEALRYASVVSDRDTLLVLPNDDFNLLKTRQWIRDHAERFGHEKHWQLDDNLIEFRRLWKGRRIPCHAGMALHVCEIISDRYENVGISGLNYQMFVPADTPVPYFVNVHVYSCTLINHAMPLYHRLIYNDDTDICLQALTGGWCTILVNSFMANKLQTMVSSGGNTDGLYQVDGVGDAVAASASDTMGRFEMAAVLRRAWPDLVEVSRRFDRYQHRVDWGEFTRCKTCKGKGKAQYWTGKKDKDGHDIFQSLDQPCGKCLGTGRGYNPEPRLRPGVDLAALPENDEYGMVLRAVKQIKNPAIRTLYEEGIS